MSLQTRPTTTIPSWATASGATVQPTAAKQAAGFITSEKPPAKFFNWLFAGILPFLTWLKNPIFNPVDTSDTPLIAYVDQNTNARGWVDHNGYAGMGRVSEFVESWWYIPTVINFTSGTGHTVQNRWTFGVVGTGGAINLVTQGTGKWLQMAVNGAATCTMQSPPLFVTSADASFVLECEALMVSGFASGNAINFSIEDGGNQQLQIASSAINSQKSRD